MVGILISIVFDALVVELRDDDPPDEEPGTAV